VAAVMLVMAARTLPAVRAAVRPLIDYAGIVLVAAGSCGLVLAWSIATRLLDEEQQQPWREPATT
jgi:hypothetical protein